MPKRKKTYPIPLFVSLLTNLKNGKKKEYMSYTSLFVSLWRNLKNGKNKEDISYISLRFSLEEP
jgi:hypothetical protein